MMMYIYFIAKTFAYFLKIERGGTFLLMKRLRLIPGRMVMKS